MSDATYRQDIETGRFGDAVGVTDAPGEIRSANTSILTFHKRIIATGTMLKDAMAADVTAEQIGITIPHDGIVTRIEIVADATVTGHDTNNAVVTVSKRDAAGANKTTLGTLTTTLTGTVNTLTAFVPFKFALTNANLLVVKNGSLTFEIAKNAAGVVMEFFKINVFIKRTGVLT